MSTSVLVRTSRFFAWLAVLLLLGAEVAIQYTHRFQRVPLLGVSVPATGQLTRFGATDVDISFSPFCEPSTLQVSLSRQWPGHAAVVTDVSDLFIAKENGAVGSLTGLVEGTYVVKARVFGWASGRQDLFIEEEARVSFTVPPLPFLDLATSVPSPKFTDIFRAGHPVWRRCAFKTLSARASRGTSGLKYAHDSWSSRLAGRAPCSGKFVTEFRTRDTKKLSRSIS